MDSLILVFNLSCFFLVLCKETLNCLDFSKTLEELWRSKAFDQSVCIYRENIYTSKSYVNICFQKKEAADKKTQFSKISHQ